MPEVSRSMMETNDIGGRIREIMADILEVEPGAIDAGFRKEDARLWDSVRHLYLMTAVEEEFGIKRSEEHTSELQSLMRISYAVFCLKHNKKHPPAHQCKNITYNKTKNNHDLTQV